MINKVVLTLALSSIGATTTHYNINCYGCPDSDGAYSETWCNEDNSLVKSDWCNTSEERCEGNCNGHWCETGDAEWGYSGDLDEHNWVDLGYPDCAGGTDPDGDGRNLLATQSPIDIRFGADGKTSMEASTAFGGIDSYAFAATGAEFAVTQSHGAPKFSFTLQIKKCTFYSLTLTHLFLFAVCCSLAAQGTPSACTWYIRRAPARMFPVSMAWWVSSSRAR